MTTTTEVLDLHAIPHPAAPIRQAGFPLDDPYLEHCWTPVIGPSSVLLLRRCAWLWREATPARITTEELARQLGLGRGTGRSSSVWHTIERVASFRFAAMPTPGELHVYTEVPPVSPHQLEHLPGWCQDEHERLLGRHLDTLARSAGQAPPQPDTAPPSHLRMADRLDRLANKPSPAAPILSR